MGATIARFIDKNTQHFDATSLTTLGLLLDPAGNLSATAAGLKVTADAVNGRGAIDPVADGGTSVLPTAAGPDTTINSGVAIAFGDYYMVTTAGTVGTALTVSAAELPALLIYNGGTITADSGWSLVKNTDTAGLAANTVILTAGAGMTGGGTLAADRTFDVIGGNGIIVAADDVAVQSDVTTGGDVLPASVTANGVGFDQSGIVADQLTIAYAPTGVTPDAAGAIANGAPAGTVATDLAAVLEGFNDKIDAGPSVTTNIAAGAGLTGGGTIAADRTINFVGGNGFTVNVDDVQIDIDTETGGTIVPINVTANGLGLDTSLLPSGVTVESFTLAAGDITGGVTLSGTPTSLTSTRLTIRGAPSQQYTTDFAVAGTTLSFTAGLQALLLAGDEITVAWL